MFKKVKAQAKKATNIKIINETLEVKLQAFSEGLKTILQAEYNEDRFESTAHSKAIIQETSDLIDEMLNNNGHWYFMSDTFQNKLFDLFEKYDNREGTFVPVVYNPQTKQFAEVILQFLDTIDLELDINQNMRKLFKSGPMGKPESEINRIRSRLNDKIEQFDIAINPEAALLKAQFMKKYTAEIDKILIMIENEKSFDEIAVAYNTLTKKSFNDLETASNSVPCYQIIRRNLRQSFTPPAGKQVVDLKPEEVEINLLQMPPDSSDFDYDCAPFLDSPYRDMFTNEMFLNEELIKKGYDVTRMLTNVRKTVDTTVDKQEMENVTNEINGLFEKISNTLLDYNSKNKPHKIKQACVDKIVSQIQNYDFDGINNAYCFKASFLYTKLHNMIVEHHKLVNEHNASHMKKISLGKFNDYLDGFVTELRNLVKEVTFKNNPGMGFQLEEKSQYPQEVALQQQMENQREGDESVNLVI